MILLPSLNVVSHSRKVSDTVLAKTPLASLLHILPVRGKWTSEPPPPRHERGVKSRGCLLVTSNGITLNNFVEQAAWHCPLPYIVLQSNGP